MGVGGDFGRIEIAAHIAGAVFLGENHRRVAEILGADAGNADAAGLDGEDLVDRFAGKAAGKFLPHGLIKADIDLMI